MPKPAANARSKDAQARAGAAAFDADLARLRKLAAGGGVGANLAELSDEEIRERLLRG